MENFQNRSGTLEDYLYKDERNNISKVVNKDKKGAKYAKLDYEVIGYKPDKDLSLVKVNLHTGRHHQIRLQMSHSGHSIFGDQKYGTRGKGKQIALWAYYLEFEHPVTKKKMQFTVYPESKGTWNWKQGKRDALFFPMKFFPIKIFPMRFFPIKNFSI